MTEAAGTVAAPVGGAIAPARRLALLRGVPAFAALPDDALGELAERLREERRPAGIVVAEGDPADRLFIIVEGRAEVTTAGPDGPVVLAALGPGDLYGEVALHTPDRERQATVTALTPLLLLGLDDAALGEVCARFPAARAALAAGAEAQLVAKFLKRVGPFATLAPERARKLAGRVTRREVPGGATIVRQGERGETCYLLRRGRVEVLVEAGGEAGGGTRRLTTLEAGALFGEAALLTDAPRNATVRALEPCELLALRRADLLEAMGADPAVAARLRELVQLRDRPRQAQGILAHQRVTATGETIITLKDPRRGVYYRLSPQGWFIWQRLDGQHTLRDLTLDYLRAFQRFAPDAVVAVLGGLAAAGFVAGVALRPDVAGLVERADRSRWRRAAGWARRVVEWYLPLRNVDATLTRLYRAGIWLLFTRPAQLLFIAVILGGLAAFVLESGRQQATLAQTKAGGALLLFLIPAYLLSLLVHEAGHAFATKAFGREVRRVGIGWYWFEPIAFVDTSDMWLADRRQRIVVSLAGIYADLLLAGLAALAAWLLPMPIAAAALWQFALTSYVMVLFNLNPLLEYDGYFVLIDLLERPNLRRRAIAWLGRECPSAVRRRGLRGLRGHRLDVLYALASLLYVGVEVALTVAFYRLLVQGWLAHLLPATLAEGLVWALVVGVVSLTVTSVAGELRDPRVATAAA